MRRLGSNRRQFAKCLLCLLAAVLLGGWLLGAGLTRAAGDDGNTPAWATPSAMAVKHVGPTPDIQHEPNLLNNLDCSLVSYKPAAGGDIRTGCFTPTAYGLLDSDSDTAIFNGSGKGLQLLPYSAGQVLVGWPGALDMVALDAANTGGSYISLYRDPLAALRDQRNATGELTAKQLSLPPDLILRGPDGKQLVINPQTMAFSDGGSWLVAETLGGSFVRINLATLDIVAFAPAFGSQGSPALLKSQVAVSDDGRYVAISNDIASSLKVYDLAACGGAAVGLQPQSCASYDYWPFLGQQISGLQSVRHLRFVNSGLLSLEARTDNLASNGVYELAPRGSITSLIDYLGLGDSYTSGEGAGDYLAGADNGDNMCHLSANSYPLLLAHDLFSSAGGHSVACSGAVINDVGSTSLNYRGQVRGVAAFSQLQQTQADLLNEIMANYSLGYVAQQRFVKQYQPAITTVSVGGNDIGFGDILQRCVEPHVSLHAGSNTCYGSYEDRLEVTNLIDRTVPRWTALYRQLAAEAPGTRLYAIGYPQIAVDNGNCALNVHLDKAELEFAEELIDYLDGAIRQAAGAGGATYVDISQALAGHRLCEAASYDVAVNGLTAGTDAGPLGSKIFGKGSYHPNALGQALVEQAILRQTNNLDSIAPVTSVNPDGQALLNVPKTGRIINMMVPDDGLTSGLAEPGRSTTVTDSGTVDGLKPNTVYSIRLDGVGGPVIGTTTSGTDGDISTSVTLPGNTLPGEHTIDITGQNQAGEPVDVTQPVYVPVSDNDADGDGIPDSLDTCPGAANSGQDSDQDGVDDSCDPTIGPPATTGGQGSSGNQSGAGQVDTNGASGNQATPGHQDSSAANSDTGNIEAALNRQALTAVASFASSSDSQTIADPAAGQKPSNSAGTARLLGAATANLATAGDKSFKTSSNPGPKAGKHSRPLTSLYVINWLAWVVLLAIVWLLVLLGLAVRRLAGWPVSTTMGS